MTAIKLPYSEELEQSVLGSILIDESLLSRFFKEWAIEWFYSPVNKIIITQIFELWLSGISIDLLSLNKILTEKGLLDTIGWLSYLTDLTDIAITYNFDSHSQQLAELYKRREIIKEAERLKKLWLSWDIDTGTEDIIKSINSILSEWRSLATSSEENIEKLKTHIEQNKGKDMLGYSFWVSFLDKHTKGIRKGKTYRIGSPSGVGKTNLIYQIINSLMSQDAKVLFISLENSIETTYIKLLASYQKVNPNLLEFGTVEPDYTFLEKYKNQLILTDQLFDFAEIKREVVRTKPDVVILDYIGLVNIKWTDERTKYDKYADWVKEFLQKNNSIAWIDLSNLNKDDDEERIRMHRGFNWAAKLRNNTDVAIHMFYWKPFYDYREKVNQIWSEEAKEWIRAKQAITFLISKNRLWVDWVEDAFLIDFNKGINYEEMTKEKKDSISKMAF